MKIKRLSLLFAAIAAIAIPQLHAEDYRVTSPDGQTALCVALNQGRLTYSVTYAGQTMLEASPLGLKSNIGIWNDDLTIKKVKVDDDIHKKAYKLRQGKQSFVNYAYRSLDIEVANAKNGLLDITFQVSDNNIAFRYRIPAQKERLVAVVNEELTGFNLPDASTAFICPQSDAMIGWCRTKPSYEEGYIWDELATTKSNYGHGWTFPCLFKVVDNAATKGWVLISETGVTSEYCASHLSDATQDAVFTIAYPMAGENNGFGSTGAQIGLAGDGTSPHDFIVGYTPWRTITLGSSLKPIVETTIPWDVLEPLYEPKAEYKGSRNTWSWIIWQDASINYDDQITYIDLAASLGWEGCLIDGGWYKNIGRSGMERLFAYCKQKGIRPWVWYNSNGGWNDAPQCARHCMSNPIQRKAEMSWLRAHGVAGIKVDFFAGDKQETMRLYEAILSDANEYGIQVICHGCTLPRGWEILYPNYCGSEAVLASENLYFSQDFCNMEARHACLHPFVRNAVGSMEYGGTVLQKRIHREPNKGNTRRTSDIFELATAVAFQCSGQNFALTPRNLTENPQFEIDFMKAVPTTWDETRFIDGYPGKYIVLARRHGQDWYVVAMNAEKTARKIQVELPMFAAGQQVTCLNDGKDGKTPQSSKMKIGKNSRVVLTLQSECAAVIMK